jgi:hypothetical protein
VEKETGWRASKNQILEESYMPCIGTWTVYCMDYPTRLSVMIKTFYFLLSSKEAMEDM